jgi:endonuclease YncB( thermonuclease family)
VTSYRNLSNKFFTPPELGYYNLHTGRVITAPSKKNDTKRIFLDQYRVVGNREELLRFAELNSLVIDQLTPPVEETRLAWLFRMLTLSPSPPPKEEIVLAPSVVTHDVLEIPSEMEETLGDFTLVGMTGKGKVTNIIDGDTVRIRIFVSLGYLMRVQPTRTRGDVSHKSAILGSHDLLSRGFHAVFICRLDGVDGAEHNTSEGIEATKLLTTILSKVKNVVYVKCGHFDKYGRLLTTIYLDGKYTHPLNDELLKRPALFEPYDGGTKSAYMKSRPPVTPVTPTTPHIP